MYKYLIFLGLLFAITEVIHAQTTTEDVLQTDYAITPEEVENIEKRQIELIAQNENLSKNSSRTIASLDNDTRKSHSTEVENLNQCSMERQFYEKQINKSTKLKDLLVTREMAESKLSKQCITHIMKRFSVSNRSYANCSKSTGATQTPGAKPCVTENLVNLTYNSYMDVTECLNLDPKLLMSKIGYESGFFINALGSAQDGGLGQLTRPAIAEVNNHVERYVAEIAKAAASKPSCARLLKYKSFFKKVPIEAEERCSVIGLPENPLKNILYMALLNRINMDQISGIKYVAGHDYLNKNRNIAAIENNENDEMGGAFKTYAIKEKLVKLGIKNPNMHTFKDIIALVGYNTGVRTAMNIFRNYLDQRIENKLKLTLDDFDFNNTKIKKDPITGEVKDVVSIARSYVMSSFINPNNPESTNLDKAKRRNMLPKLWSAAYTKTFPEYLTYKANSYDGKSSERYNVYGFPGYLNLVAERNKIIRADFESANLDPNLCSDPNFLKMKN
ncbi:MAG: hypothetical protein AABY53_10590 [Bdellovibrionota bacterium]